MIRAAVTIRRIPMTGVNNQGLQLLRPDRGRVKVGEFEPEQHPIARRKGGVPNGAMMVRDVPVMELEEELPARDEALVVRATVPALAAQELLIPAAAGLDIANADEWLWLHGSGPWPYLNS
jgi:hypothetical protein